MAVAVEMRVRAAAEVRHDPGEIDEEDEDARGGERDAEGPAPACEREPDGEADDGDRGILPASERQHQSERAPRVAAGVEGGRGPHDGRDRKRLRVDVADVDSVERRVDEVQQREGRRRPRSVRTQTPRGVAEDGDRAGAEDRRLSENERGPAGDEPAERDQQVEDRREVVAPGVHGRQRHVGAVAVGD